MSFAWLIIACEQASLFTVHELFAYRVIDEKRTKGHFAPLVLLDVTS